MTTPSDEKMKIPIPDVQRYRVCSDAAAFVPDDKYGCFVYFADHSRMVAALKAELEASQEQVRRLTEALKKADKCVALGTYPLAIETLSFGRRNAS